MWSDIWFIIIAVSLLFLAFNSLRAIYVAFIKKKDERSKWIVTKSMAESFIVNSILQAIIMAMKWSNYVRFHVWWENFKDVLYIEPAVLSFMILGVILIINTHRNGGSL